MREHQIVINLKPEQFEEVQRMARAAGLKSVNSFVRQKLIATLGLAAPGAGAVEENDGPDLKQLTGELRRLHRELQIFVADSLSNSDYAVATIEPIPFPTAVQENFLAEGAPLMPESVGFSYRDDTMVSLPFSETSDLNTFSTESVQGQSSFGQPQNVSSSDFSRPQLPGQFPPADRPQYSNFQAPIVRAATPQTTDLQASSAIPDVGNSSASNSVLQPAYAMPPDPANVAPRSASTQPAFSVPEPPPESPSPSVPGQTQSATPAQVQPSVPPQTPPAMPHSAPQTKSVQQFAENDELEDLAERAFAISPRLGQLDEAQKRFPDPLRDLLEDALFNEDDDEQTTDEDTELVADASSSASESEADALEATEDASDIAESSQTASYDEEASEVEEYEAADPEEVVSEKSIEEEFEEGEENPGSQASSGSEPPQDDGPPDPPQQFPPPVSGGPPPRKRRT